MKSQSMQVLENGNKVISTLFIVNKGEYIWTETEYKGSEIIRYKDVTETKSGTLEVTYSKYSDFRKVTNYLPKVA